MHYPANGDDTHGSKGGILLGTALHLRPRRKKQMYHPRCRTFYNFRAVYFRVLSVCVRLLSGGRNTPLTTSDLSLPDPGCPQEVRGQLIGLSEV